MLSQGASIEDSPAPILYHHPWVHTLSLSLSAHPERHKAHGELRTHIVRSTHSSYACSGC